MRTLGRWTLVVVTLTLCGAAAWLAGPTTDAPPPPVSISLDVPRRAVLHEPVILGVRVTNHGTRAIDDLGIKINRGYANALTVIETEPRAQIDDASTEKRLYFGPLAAGATETYSILMSPRLVGDFNLTLRVVAARRGITPEVLQDRDSGATELSATTVIADVPARATPTGPIGGRP